MKLLYICALRLFMMAFFAALTRALFDAPTWFAFGGGLLFAYHVFPNHPVDKP